MRTVKLMTAALSLLAAVGCGSGGNSGGGPDGAVSGHVPFLVSSPSVTFATNALNATKYDVTITIEADGPTGVAFVSAWIFDDTNTNFASLDLVPVPATKQWRATTNALVPLPPGQYRVDNVRLHDGDPLAADPLRTGWYLLMDAVSTSSYFVDEREMSGVTFLYYNTGLSSIPVTRFTLP